jgi:hypothetical protein
MEENQNPACPMWEEGENRGKPRPKLMRDSGLAPFACQGQLLKPGDYTNYSPAPRQSGFNECNGDISPTDCTGALAQEPMGLTLAANARNNPGRRNSKATFIVPVTVISDGLLASRI